MDQKELSRKIAKGNMVFYRRVSTKAQAKGELVHQLHSLKSRHPQFKVTGYKVVDLKEAISGFATPEKRIAGKLGSALRHLKHNPNAIMVVTSADRISRTAEIFDLILAQSLGDRIFDVSTGESVTDIILSGKHKKIEAASKAQRQARAKGRRKYILSGGVLGQKSIGKQTQKATKHLKAQTEELLKSVLKVVSRLVIRRRGLIPTYDELTKWLDQLQIRTGKEHLFTPERLAQLKKVNRTRWQYANDSYRRPRRRIARLVEHTQIEIQRRREAQKRTCRLDQLGRNASRTLSKFRTLDSKLSAHSPCLLDLAARDIRKALLLRLNTSVPPKTFRLQI